MNIDDVTVIQRSDNPAFIEKTIQLRWIIDFSQQLDGDMAPQGFLYRQVNGGRTALGNQVFDFVTRYRNVHSCCALLCPTLNRDAENRPSQGGLLAVPGSRETIALLTDCKRRLFKGR
jgi:hypothetical protein